MGEQPQTRADGEGKPAPCDRRKEAETGDGQIGQRTESNRQHSKQANEDGEGQGDADEREAVCKKENTDLVDVGG
jgi:hypothetical protein